MVTTAFAQELKLNYPFEPKAVVVEGKSGVWFPPKDAEYILYLRRDVIPTLMDKETALVNKLDLMDKEVNDLNAKITLLEDKYKIQAKGQETCSKELQKCLNKPNAWWEHPAIWIGVGVLVGAGATILVAKTVK
jgi:hypothetical protein